jgi:uncharacterized membrane protein YphA (DoxX/SURF4 family)
MLAVFRIVAGLLFMSFGSMKLFGYPPGPTEMPPLEIEQRRAGDPVLLPLSLPDVRRSGRVEHRRVDRTLAASLSRR